MYKITLLTLILCAFAISTVQAAPPLAAITRIQGEAAVVAPTARPLAKGGAVHAGDVLSTGADARLEITFPEGTVLTLGENTEFTIDSFIVNEAVGRGWARLSMLKGAFRFASGGITKMAGTDVEVATPLATLGIRGTDFWGGYLNPEAVDVFLYSGKPISVTNDLGTQTLDPGTGTTLKAGAPPTVPIRWGKKKIGKATDTVRFGKITKPAPGISSTY